MVWCRGIQRRTVVFDYRTILPKQLFNATKVGVRVIVALTDVRPVPIMHPLLFPSKTDTAVIAAARAAEADNAARKADEARLAAAAASREVARTTASVRATRNLKLSAEAQLATAERAAAYAASAEAKEQAEDAKAKAAARFAELEAELSGAVSEPRAKLNKVALAREATITAEAASAAAVEDARKTALDLESVSIFISRKTQRLYVRRTFRPVLEIPVTIRDPDCPDRHARLQCAGTRRWRWRHEMERGLAGARTSRRSYSGWTETGAEIG